MTTNEINYLSKSLAASVAFSKNNHRAEVIIAKRGDLSAVVRSIYGNRSKPHYEFGYCRFGRKAVWVGVTNFFGSHAAEVYNESHTAEYVGEIAVTVGEANVRDIAAKCFRAADEVTALRSAA